MVTLITRMRVPSVPVFSSECFPPGKMAVIRFRGLLSNPIHPFHHGNAPAVHAASVVVV